MSCFSFDRPATCGLGYPVSLRHATLVFGRASPVHLVGGFQFLAPLAVASVPQLAATVAGRAAAPTTPRRQ